MLIKGLHIFNEKLNLITLFQPHYPLTTSEYFQGAIVVDYLIRQYGLQNFWVFVTDLKGNENIENALRVHFPEIRSIADFQIKLDSYIKENEFKKRT